MYTTLEKAKPHLNIDSSYTGDDVYIADLIEVCEAVISKEIGVALSEFEDEGGNIPAPLRQATLLMVGNFYANREPVAFASSSEIPLSYKYLVQFYRDYSK